MTFYEVSTAFEAIEQVSGRLEITRILSELLGNATSEEAAIICNLSLGQLHPPYVGTQFNIAKKTALPVVAKVLDESERDITQQLKTTGDLGAIVVQGRWRISKELSVQEVYDALCDIEQISGTGSQQEKADYVSELLRDVKPLSAKFVLRIILGKLRLGFSDMTIIDALSWMEVGDKSLRSTIEDAYNMCADIGYIASQLKSSGIKALERMRIHVGIPIRPAAAERAPTAAAVFKKLGTCVAQPKLDGFRLQIHVDNTKRTPKVDFFSRNLQDMSAMFPDLVPVFEQLKVDTLICEGEAIAYDPNTGTFLPFQETVKRKRKHDIEGVMSELPLRVFIFDVLYLNGESLLDLGHEERRALLLKTIPPKKDALVQPIDEVAIKTADQLQDYFVATVADGLEGLVVKKPNAIYQPGKRNFNWIKLKRKQEGNLEDTVDCVVLGYYDGSGRRAAFGIGAFLVGVYNKKNDNFETIAKVGTGLKDEQWKELKKKCDELAVGRRPTNVVCPKDLVPNVWVAPEMVVTILADEITLSPVHMAGKTEDTLGYALRFPRFMGYRTDKGPDEATTAREIVRLYKDQF